MGLSICYWSNYTKSKVKLPRKSENAVDSDHVLKFTYDEEAGVVNAIVQASMGGTSSSVTVSILCHT